MVATVITIRCAVLADYDKLCALWAILDEHHRIALPNIFRVPKGPPRELSYVRSLVDGSDSVILVAESEEQELLGFATVIVRTQTEMPFRAERRYAEIDNMVVRQAVRRRGIGTSLIEAATQWAERQGIKTIELVVHDFNEDALSFYRSIGFSTVFRRMARSAQK